ncbi:MAG: HD domain-containing protein [Paludibacteraceae bacterium]|nr:HD domain-containing protein [Paludibacteraceae bacterium]MBQ6983528.1 HD domain-containing protein [Paludibacteraceae bacterium]
MPNKRKIINDPVFGFLSIPNELIYDVLQHPYVQRLNRIRQLGLSYLVYPGAMHSRFGHSIGAMHLMREAILSLRLKGVEITEDEETSAMIAILLHDIGHGPFSHVLEHTIVDGVTHEDISLLMMERINMDLNGQLDMAISIFKNEYPKHFLHQLISSQLDVDRMDYLCRDSFFTGVQEGRVASERLLKMLDVRDDKLVVQVKGIYSVEKFLVARRLMYWQVYLHKTSVAAEQHLIKILCRAKELARSGKDLFCSPALRYFLYQPVTFDMFSPTSEALEQYALLDDNDVLSAIKSWIAGPDKVLSLLSRSFINRQLFRGQLLEAPLTEAQKNELNRQYAEALSIDEKEAEYCWSEHVSTSNTYSEKADSIDILYSDGTVRDIASASEILDLAALTRKPIKRYLFKYRLD